MLPNSHPKEYLALSEAAKISGYTAEYLRQLCVKGKLDAHKIGKSWVTTLDAIEKFKAGAEQKQLTLDQAIGTSVSSYTRFQKFAATGVALVVFFPAVSQLTSLPERISALQDKTRHLSISTQNYFEQKIQDYIRKELQELGIKNYELGQKDAGQIAGAIDEQPHNSSFIVPHSNPENQPGKILGESISESDVQDAVRAIIFNEPLPSDVVARLKGEKGDKGDPGLAGETTVHYIPNSGQVFGITAPTAPQGHSGTIGSATYLSAKEFRTEKLFATDLSTLVDTDITGNLTVSGNIDATGNLTIVGDTTLTGNLLPGTDNTFNLGSPDARWADLHLGPDSLNIYSTAGNAGAGNDYVLGNLGFNAGALTLTTANNGASIGGQINFVSSFPSGNLGTAAFNITTSDDLDAGDEVLNIGDSAGTLLTIFGNGNVTATGLGTFDSASITNSASIGTALTVPTIYGSTAPFEALTLRGTVSPSRGPVLIPDATTVDAALVIGSDTNLYRSAADVLRTDDSFLVGSSLTVNGSIISLAGDSTIIDLVDADSTLAINTTTNRPVTFGTGLVTIPNLSVTNSQSNNGTMVIDSAATTATIFEVIGNSLTSGTAITKTVTANAGNGQITGGEMLNLVDSTVAGGGFTGIGITVTGSGTGTGDKYLLSLNPNTANNQVVFDNAGAFRPTTSVASNTATIGSPSFYWKNGYFDQITANNLAGTVITGATSSTTWTIGSTEAGDVNEAIIFQRNSGSGNATIQWNAGANDLRYLTVNYPFNSTYTVDDLSIGTGINLYSGNLTNNTTSGTQRLLSLTNAGTGTTEHGIFVSNAGTGATALEIDGTWTNGIVTNNNSVNIGTGSLTAGTSTLDNLILGGGYGSTGVTVTTDGDISADGNLTVGGQTQLADGSTSAPSLVFTSAPTTGWHASGIDGWNFDVLGSNRIRLTGDVGGPGIRMGSGMGLHWSSTAGTLASGTIDTSILRAGANNLAFGRTTGVRLNFSVADTLNIQNFAGSAGATVQVGTLSFDGDTFLHRRSAGVIEQRNGTDAQELYIYNTYTDASNYERLRIGWSSNTVRFVGQAAGTGSSRTMQIQTGGDLQFGSGNGIRWVISGGHLRAYADNAYDIGAVSDNRPRNLYLAGNAVVGGSLTVSGSITHNGNVTITKQDPTVIFNAGDTNDTKFWAGVTDDNGNDDDDLFQIGDGATPGTNPFLTIDTSGNVGIGTTNPGELLHIYGGTSDTKLKIYSTTNNVGLHLEQDGATDSSWLVQTVPTDGRFRIYDAQTATAEALSILQSGNVGIGTANPQAALHLSRSSQAVNSRGNLFVSSDTAFAADAGGSIGFGGMYTGFAQTYWAQIAGRKEVSTSGNYAGYLQFSTRANGVGAVEAMRITSAGNVGIGTTNPVNLLHVGAGGDTPTIVGSGATIQNLGAAALTVRDATNDIETFIYSGASLGLMGTATAHDLQLRTGNSAKLTIQHSTGNIGIGTTNPLSRLTNTSSGANVASDGFEWLSTENDYAANIKGAPAAGNSYGLRLSVTGTTNSDFPLVIGSGAGAGTIHTVVTGAGNVGIGTTGPEDRLDIRSSSTSGSNIRLESTDTGGRPWRIISAGSASPGSLPAGYFGIRDGFNSANRFVIDTSGNVGIGTIGPDGFTHILRSSAGSVTAAAGASTLVLEETTTAGLSFLSNATTGEARIWFGDPDDNDIGRIEYAHATDQMRFRTNAADRMVIDSAGNVGIGAASPSGKLHVAITDTNTSIGGSAGQIALRISNQGTTNNQWSVINFNNGGSTGTATAAAFGVQYTNSASNYADFAFATRGTTGFSERMRITSDGNVGIGTTSPNTMLQINKNSGSGEHIQITNTGTGSTSGDGVLFGLSSSEDLELWNREATNLILGTNNLERMRIDSSGNVGIGTTNPAVKLHLANPSQNTNAFRLSSWSDSYYANFTYDASGQTRTTLNHVSGGLSGGIDITVDGTTGVSVLKNGNVGIGTTSPNKTLTVNAATGAGLDIVHGSVAHGMTTELPTNSYLYIRDINGVDGGAQITGASDVGTVGGIQLRGLIGSSDPTDTVPAVLIEGSKANGTGRQALGSLETVLKVRNGASSDLMTILGSGNVGIGTTNPEDYLTVNSTSDTTFGINGGRRAEIFLRSDDDNNGTGNSHAAIRFDISGGDQWWTAGVDNGDSNKFKIGSASDFTNNRLTIDTSGNVGIGTTSPGALLDVRGSAIFNEDGADADFRIESDANANSYIHDAGLFSGVGAHAFGRTNGGDTYFGVAPPALTTAGGGTSFSKFLVTNAGVDTTIPNGSSGIHSSARFNEPRLVLEGTFTGTAATVYIDNAPTEGAVNAALYVASGNTILGATSGNVGIGTTNPGRKLSVVGGTALIENTGTGGQVNDILRLYDTTTAQVNTGPAIRFVANRTTGGSTLVADVAGIITDISNGAPKGALVLSTINSGGGTPVERMRIDHSGNVGIGTTNPTAKLHIVDGTGAQIDMSSNGSSASGLRLYNTFDGANRGLGLYWRTDNGSGVATDSAYMVGMLNTSGGTEGRLALRLLKSSALTEMLTFNADNTAASPLIQLNSDLDTGIYHPAADALGFSTAATERLRIDASGNVGIGTTTPSAKLHVAGGAADTTIMVSGKADNSVVGRLQYLNGFGTTLNLTKEDGTETVRLRSYGDSYINGGNVGIGTTSPITTLQLSGNQYIGSESSLTTDITSPFGTPKLSLVTNQASNFGLVSIGNSANTTGAQFIGAKTRATDASADVIVQNADQVLAIKGFAADGASYREAARIQFDIDGTPGASDMPGRITFSTTADGAASVTERMRITSSGTVAIGTTSPLSSNSGLDISSGGIGLVVGADNNLSSRTNATSKYARIGFPHFTNAEEPIALLFASSDGSNNTVMIGGGTSALNSANILAFYTGSTTTTVTGTERMRIDASGNVGIGTTNPATKFVVVGSGAAVSTSGSTATAAFRIHGDGNGVLDISSVSGGTAYIQATNKGDLSTTYSLSLNPVGGSVGIGLTAPNNALQVKTNVDGGGISIQRNSTAENSYADIGFVMTTLDSGAARSGLRVYRRTSGTDQDISLIAGDTEGFILKDSGNVGIGTTNPTQSLDVVGFLQLGSNRTDATNKQGYVLNKHYTNAEESAFIAGGVSINGGNLVYIGGGSGSFNAATSIDFYTAANSTTLTGTSRMTINSSGNVGIGTTSNIFAKLTINGNIGTVSEGDIFSQYDGDSTTSYPVFARYWDAHGTWPSTTFIFGNGTNAAVGIEKPGNLNVNLFQVRANTSAFIGDNAGYLASFTNEGNNSNRLGISMSIGADDASGTNTAITFNDGDGTEQGTITFSGGTTSYNTTSDIRLKTNIQNTLLGLNELMQIEVRDYSFIADPAQKTHTGFIAQQLYGIYPNAVTVPNDPNGIWSVDYSKLTPLLTKGIQELNNKISGSFTGTGLAVGDVVTVSNSNQVTRSTEQGTAAGVVTSVSSANVRVGFTGRVAVKVSEENGAIHAGDRLKVSELMPGYAAKQVESGNSIGVALENSQGGTEGLDVIQVSISLGYHKVNVAQTQSGDLFTVDSDYDFQDHSLINVKTIASMSGKWEIGEDGTIRAMRIIADSVETRKLKISGASTDSTVGRDKFPVGSIERTIHNNNITPNSTVLITFRGDYQGRYWIDAQGLGNFTIKLSQAAATEVAFDYWIVDTEQEQLEQGSGDSGQGTETPEGENTGEQTEGTTEEPPVEEPTSEPEPEPTPEPESTANNNDNSNQTPEPQPEE